MTHGYEFEGWDIVEKLGEGGMCAVFRVRSPEDGTERAVKIMTDTNESAATRFTAEAKLLISLDHPNVLKVHTLHEEDPPWIVMDLLAGRDLEEHRDTEDPMRPDQIAAWFADLANGLQAVHDLGVVHRDLKPSNVMLGTDGVPRLIDFGVARDTSAARITKAGIVVGTASYLPPELFLESNPQHLQDQATADVYALGQTLCELLINRPVHDPEHFNGPKLLVQIMQDKITRPHLDPREWDDKIPDALATIVIDATQQLPEDRIQTARELEDRLRAWLHSRKAREAAPVSRADVKTLPPPPTSTSIAPTATRTAAPPKRGGSHVVNTLLGMGAVGLVGVGLVALVVVLVVGVAALMAFAPQGDPAAEAVTAALQASLKADADTVYDCVEPAGVGEFSLSVVADGGQYVSVGADVADGAALSCIRGVVEGWPAPDVGQRTAVSLPVRFR
jgi:serine/threonine-protein kinase